MAISSTGGYIKIIVHGKTDDRLVYELAGLASATSVLYKPKSTTTGPSAVNKWIIRIPYKAGIEFVSEILPYTRVHKDIGRVLN
jgi:hypothetical protein